jgi:hypothetical protein
VVVRKKGKEDREVPLSSHARDLLMKYSNRYYKENAALPSLTQMTLNKSIREAAFQCGLDRKVQDPQEPGVEKPLYMLLTAGTAIQTFIANALKLGLAVEAINTFTGMTHDKRIKILKHELAKKEVRKFDQL